jgi:hypothetical protein
MVGGGVGEAARLVKMGEWGLLAAYRARLPC